MSGTLGRFAVGVAGGAIGFFVGGPAGIAVGFSLGFAISGFIFTPDLPKKPRGNDEFQVTAATQGTPVPAVLGRRTVEGNIILFRNVEIEEVNSGGGKGFGGGAGGSSETRAFAEVHLTVCLGTAHAIHAITDSRGQDWIQANEDAGGSPIQFSLGGDVDFGYAPESAPLIGVTSVYCPRMFLGANVTSMTPLFFDVEVLGDMSDGTANPVGNSTLDLSNGINPACAYWLLLADPVLGRGLDPSSLNLSTFQDAFEIYRTEDRGIAIKQTDLTILKNAIEDLNFHTNSILRVGNDGRLELYPIRSTNYVPVPVTDVEIADPQCSAQTWDKVDSVFLATFPDATKKFTQQPVQWRNEAVISMLGRSSTKTYDFPWFTDLRNAQRRIMELGEIFSFPSPALALSIPKRFHRLRPGDVILVTDRRYEFAGEKFRVLDVTDAALGKAAMQIKCRLERDPLSVSYTPPAPAGSAPSSSSEPRTPIQVGALGTYWQNHRGPPKGPPGNPTGSGIPGTSLPAPTGTPGAISPILVSPGYPGFPLYLWAARGSGKDVAVILETVHGKEADLPVNVPGRTISPRWAYAFTTLDPIYAGDWTYAGPKRLRVQFHGYPNQVFPLQNLDGVDDRGFLRDMETSRFALVVGNTEVWLWKVCNPKGAGVYEFETCLRAANKEYLHAWPVGTPVMVCDMRAPFLSTGLAYEDWAHRQRYVRIGDFEDPTILARIRTFFQSVNHLGRAEPASLGYGDGEGMTWLDRGGIDPLAASNLYARPNEIQAERGPMPTCLAYRKGDGTEFRSWYAEAAGFGGAADWIVEFPPFPDDESGAGDRVAYDEVETPGRPYGPPIEAFGTWPAGPTDAPFDDLVGAGAAVNGQTYRLFIMGDADHPLDGTPVRTIDVVFDGSETAWPAFVYSAADQVTDGTDNAPDSLYFWVAVAGRAGAWCRPRLADKVGNYRSQRDPALAVSPGGP